MTLNDPKHQIVTITNKPKTPQHYKEAAIKYFNYSRVADFIWVSFFVLYWPLVRTAPPLQTKEWPQLIYVIKVEFCSPRLLNTETTESD